MKAILAVLGARGLGACMAQPASRRVRMRSFLMIAAGQAVRRNGILGNAPTHRVEPWRVPLCEVADGRESEPGELAEPVSDAAAAPSDAAGR